MELKCPVPAAAVLAAKSAKFHDVRAASLVRVHAEHQHVVVLDAEFPLLQPLKVHQPQKMLRLHLQKMPRRLQRKPLLLLLQRLHLRRNLPRRDCAELSTCQQAAVMPPVFVRGLMASGDPANDRNLSNLQHRSVASGDWQSHHTIESVHRQYLIRACTAALSSFSENTN